MANRKAEFDVVANDKTQAGLDSAANRFKKFGDQVERESDSIGQKSGDKIGDRVAERLAAGATRIGSVAASVGLKSGARLADSLASSLQSAGPQIQGAIVGAAAGAAVTLAPMLGAAVAGAVVGGAGIGGVVGGIVLASRDARVKNAASGLGNTVMETFTRQSSVFVGPVLEAIRMIEDRFARLQPIFQRIFTNSARYVRPLVTALLDAGEALTRSISNAIANAGPVIQVFANGIRDVGTAVAEVVNQMSTLGPEGARAFSHLFALVTGLIRLFGDLIWTLAKIYGWVTTLGGLLGNDGAGMESLSADIATVTANSGPAAVGMNALASATRNTADATLYLGRASSDTGNAAIALDQAEINLARSLEAAREAADKKKKVTVDERQALIDLNASMQETITKYSQTGQSAENVSKKTRDLRSAFIATATQMGYTRGEAEKLATQYGLIPAKIVTPVSAPGIKPTIANVRDLERAINGIDRTIDIAIRVTGSSASRSAIAAALNKQNMMADHAERFSAGAAQFALGRGFAPLAGATAKSVRPNISLTNRVRVELDGRTLAPEMYKVADDVWRERDWPERTGKR